MIGDSENVIVKVFNNYIYDLFNVLLKLHNTHPNHYFFFSEMIVHLSV